MVDGAAISANLGVNPSLDITAQAERAMALWPNKGDADQRPPLGSEYVPVPATPPRAPSYPRNAHRPHCACPSSTSATPTAPSPPTEPSSNRPNPRRFVPLNVELGSNSGHAGRRTAGGRSPRRRCAARAGWSRWRTPSGRAARPPPTTAGDEEQPDLVDESRPPRLGAGGRAADLDVVRSRLHQCAHRPASKFALEPRPRRRSPRPAC